MKLNSGNWRIALLALLVLNTVLCSVEALRSRFGKAKLLHLLAPQAMHLGFLLITLAVTPLRRLSGWNRLIGFRRMLGLFAFCYGTLHLLTYLWLDKFFAWADILHDIPKRPFITIGFSAFVLMVPLAAETPRRIRIEFLMRLREERKFPDAPSLKAQILRDARRAVYRPGGEGASARHRPLICLTLKPRERRSLA